MSKKYRHPARDIVTGLFGGNDSLLLIDPAAGSTDYGAGVIDGRAFQRLLKAQREGYWFGVRKRRSLLDSLSRNDAVASTVFFVLLVIAGLVAIFLPPVSAADPASTIWLGAGGFGMVLLFAGAAVVSERATMRSGRRTKALQDALNALEVPLFAPEDGWRSRVVNSVNTVRTRWIDLLENKNVRRDQKDELAGQVDLLLYAAARALSEDSETLGEAVTLRSDEVVRSIRATIEKADEVVAEPRIEIAPPKQDAEQLALSIIPSEPTNEEIGYTPDMVIRPYPHAEREA